MNKTILATLVLAMLVAGCHESNGDDDNGDDGDDTPTPSPTTDDVTPVITLTSGPFPTNITVGVPFNVTVTVTSEPASSSTHAGFHYGMVSTVGTPQSTWGTVYTLVSPHVNATYPGTYTVMNWTIPDGHQGHKMYARAHTLVGTTAFWGDEITFMVAL